MGYIDLLSMILPDGILDYFKIIKATKSNDYFEVWLEEKAVQDNKIDDIPVASDGFHKEIIVKDFPLRSRAVHLHIQRRRRLIEKSG